MILTQETMVEKQDGILQTMLETCVTAFWDDWYVNVFNVATANEFGLGVWSILLGSPRPYYGTEVVGVETWRKYLISRIFQMTHVCTLENITKWLKLMFPKDDIQRVYENDSYSGTDYRVMTLTYELPASYFEDPDYNILFSLRDKFFPHPAGVYTEVVSNNVIWYVGMNDTQNTSDVKGVDNSLGQRKRIMSYKYDDETGEPITSQSGILAGSLNDNPPVEMADGMYGTVLNIFIGEDDFPDEGFAFTFRADEREDESINVSWGDGIASTALKPGGGAVTHVYEEPGTYTIVISNEARWIKIGTRDETASGDVSKDALDDVSLNPGSTTVARPAIVCLSNYLESMDDMFAYCRHVASFPSSWPSLCTSAKGAYRHCGTDIGGRTFDVSRFFAEGGSGTAASPYGPYIMPPRIASHENCFTGANATLRGYFTSEWGGTKVQQAG